MRSFRQIRRALARIPGVVVPRTPAEIAGRALPPEVQQRMEADGLEPAELYASGAAFVCQNCKQPALGTVEDQRIFCGPCLAVLSRTEPPLPGTEPPDPPRAA